MNSTEIRLEPDPTYRSRVPVTVIGIGLLALDAFGCGREVAPKPLPPQSVTVAVAAETDSARTLRMSGTIEAEHSTSLSFSVPGTVQEVLVQEGQGVRAGQVLARLGSRTFEDALGIAKAEAAQAEDAYKRLEPMHRNRTVPDIKWVEVDTGVQQARLAVSMAQKSIDDTVLRAPVSGVIARRNAEPGTTAIPGVPVLTLVQTRTVLASAPVPESQVAGVRKGQRASVVVGALGRTFDGAVREIGIAANPLTRTYEIKVAVANGDGALRVGMVAEVLLPQDNPVRAVVVPPAAVRVDESGQPCVYLVHSDGTLRRTPVEVSGFLGEGTALAGVPGVYRATGARRRRNAGRDLRAGRAEADQAARGLPLQLQGSEQDEDVLDVAGRPRDCHGRAVE